MAEFRRPRLAANLLLLGIVAVWGSTFALVKDALKDASPFLFNLLRMTIASVALLIANRTALRRIPRSTKAAGLIAGTFLAAGYQLQTAGLARTSSANSALLTGLVVVFVPCLALLPLLRSPHIPKPRWTTAIGALLAFAGLILMTTPAGTALRNLLPALHAGDLLTLGCALAFAAHLLSLSHFAAEQVSQLATLQIVVCTALMLLSLPLGGPLFLHGTARLLIALLVTGILATAVAFTVQSWAQRHLSAGNVALLLTLEPVFALVVSVFLLAERLTTRALVGAALILAGIATTEMLGQRPVIPLEPI